MRKIPSTLPLFLVGCMIGGIIPQAGYTKAVSIIRSPSEVGAPLDCSNSPVTREISLEAKELEGYLDQNKTFKYWTFNGKVPAPFYRVCEGDTVVVKFRSHEDNELVHSVDFHAVTGQGGGSVYTANTAPGESRSFTFKALKPGLYVYHCASPVIAQHISHGQYGLILVQPKVSLPAVDREFYVMQGEIYAEESEKGKLKFDYNRLMNEQPTHIFFNGSSRGLTGKNALKARVGETIRVYFGVGGPNLVSSFHIIGEIFDRVYNLGSLSSPPLSNVQTVVVPAGGAVVVDLKLEVPGTFTLVDHALSRVEKGLIGELIVKGPENPDIFKKGK